MGAKGFFLSPCIYSLRESLESMQKKRKNLVSLMLLDLLPKLGILLNSDLLGLVVDQLVQAAQIHVLGEQGDNVFVESLPVRVFEVVFLTLFFMLERMNHKGDVFERSGFS